MNNFEFEKEPHVCEDCGSDQWHSTWFWAIQEKAKKKT